MLLVKPYLGCNMNCKYCYEKELRSGKNLNKMSYNLPKILEVMNNFKNTQIIIHGGEPLCLPITDFEVLLKKSFELTGRSGIQTNGSLITKEHIELFKKYKTHVGLSFDGPGELSKFRMESTVLVENNLKWLLDEKIPLSIICVLSKSNGSSGKLTQLKKWILKMNSLGISGRVNPCTDKNYALDEETLRDSYKSLAEYMTEHRIRWSPFTDVVNKLKGKNAVCVFEGCDPFHTNSATSLLGDGVITNCMRTNKNDVLPQHPIYQDIRSEILKNIPQSDNGCKDCRYFKECRGGCPSSAINEDWRNRTTFCKMWFSLFTYYESLLIAVDFQTPLKQEIAKTPTRELINGHGDWANHGDAPHGDSWRK